MDDSGKPEDLPEFGPPLPPEPLVVPDTDPIYPPSPINGNRIDRKHFKNGPCKGKRKDGLPCGFSAQKNGWCWPHDPDKEVARRFSAPRAARIKHGVPDPDRKYTSREELLSVLSERLKNFTAKHANTLSIPPGATLGDLLQIVDGMTKIESTVCQIIKTMATVMSVETADGADLKGWVPKPVYETVDAPKSATG